VRIAAVVAINAIAAIASAIIPILENFWNCIVWCSSFEYCILSINKHLLCLK
jgi:hypothetical protein